MNFISFQRFLIKLVVLAVLTSSCLAFALDMPQRGMSKEKVLREFGNPMRKIPAIGQPPISRWVYSDYIVYFQNSYVINTVLTHVPQSQ